MQSRTKNSESETCWATIVKRGTASSGYGSPASMSRSMSNGTEESAITPLIYPRSPSYELSAYEMNECCPGPTVSNGAHRETVQTLYSMPLSPSDSMALPAHCSLARNGLNPMEASEHSAACSPSVPSNAGSAFAVIGMNVDQYSGILKKELLSRQWHNGNLIRTITRNLTNYQWAEHKLREMIVFHKEEYESSLEGQYPADGHQQELVHRAIREMLESEPQTRSKSMKMVDRKLAEGRSQLKSFDSFHRWQREIEQFVGKIKGQKTLSAEELEVVRVFAVRNAVEMEKVKENHLLLELQKMAEHYHETLVTLRMELKWWQKRYQLLASDFSSELSG